MRNFTGKDIYLCIDLFNSLAPGRFQFNFRLVIFKLTLVNGGWGISYEIVLRWMPLDLIDDKSTLVQAWCRQATSHYLSQCWPRSMLPNGVTRPQWVNSYPPDKVAAKLQIMTLKSSFVDENWSNLLIEVCSWACVWSEIIIALFNGLVRNRQQAII